MYTSFMLSEKSKSEALAAIDSEDFIKTDKPEDQEAPADFAAVKNACKAIVAGLPDDTKESSFAINIGGSGNTNGKGEFSGTITFGSFRK